MNNVNLFASPFAANQNYKKAIEQKKYDDWVNRTGAEMRQRQTKLLARWQDVKKKRDEWWIREERLRVGHLQSYIPPVESVGTPVVGHGDVDDAAKSLQELDKLPDLE